MKTKIAKFLSLMKVELEETEEDLRSLLAIYQTYEKNGQITNYVLQENSTLIQSEIAALHSLRKFLEHINPEGYEELNTLSESMLNSSKEFIEKKGYPQALYYLIERKVQKIIKYLSME